MNNCHGNWNESEVKPNDSYLDLTIARWTTSGFELVQSQTNTKTNYNDEQNENVWVLTDRVITKKKLNLRARSHSTTKSNRSGTLAMCRYLVLNSCCHSDEKKRQKQQGINRKKQLSNLNALYWDRLIGIVAMVGGSIDSGYLECITYLEWSK